MARGKQRASEPIAPRTAKTKADEEDEGADCGALELRPQSQVQAAPSRVASAWTPNLELPFQHWQGPPAVKLRGIITEPGSTLSLQCRWQ